MSTTIDVLESQSQEQEIGFKTIITIYRGQTRFISPHIPLFKTRILPEIYSSLPTKMVLV